VRPTTGKFLFKLLLVKSAGILQITIGLSLALEPFRLHRSGLLFGKKYEFVLNPGVRPVTLEGHVKNEVDYR